MFAIFHLPFLVVFTIITTAYCESGETVITPFHVEFNHVPGERIIGGTETVPNEFPWYALLTTRTRQQFCGASILSEEFVLTATHCMVLNKEDFFVAAGVHRRLLTIDGTEQYAKVEEIFNHPDYMPLPMENDVTILRVNPPFKFNQYVGAVRLPELEFEPEEIVTAIGWGNTNYTNTDGSFSPPGFLKKINLNLIPTENCSKMYEPVTWPGGIPSKITDQHVCAGSERDRESVCQGDSGGGLLCKDKLGRHYVCGIASFLAGCGFKEYPSVFTRVSSYLDFIKSKAIINPEIPTTITPPNSGFLVSPSSVLYLLSMSLMWMIPLYK